MASSATPCRFYLQGRCRNGDECAFLHIVPSPSGSTIPPDTAVTYNPQQKTDPELERQLKGARVCFFDGARVSCVDLPSSAIRGFPPSFNPQVCTVLCSWYNPSRVVWLHYRSNKWASRAIERFDSEFQGRRITIKLQPPPKHHALPKAIWSVQLSNVPGNSSKEDIQACLKGVQPDKIVLGKPTSETTKERAVELVKAILTLSDRKLHSFHVDSNKSGSRTKAYARFERALDMRAALELNGDRLSEIGSKLFIDHVAAVTIPFLRQLYPVLQERIQNIQAIEKEGTRISATDRTKSTLMFLRVYGPKTQAVSKVTAQLAKMLAGTVVINDRGSALWHDFFSTPNGLSALKNIYRKKKLFIYRDARKRHLVFYGSITLLEATYRSVLEIITTHTSSYLIPLPDVAFARALSGTFRQLVRSFGRKNVKLDILSQPARVIFKGCPQDYDSVRMLLLDPSTPTEDGRQIDYSKDCPLCFSEAADPVILGCGHVYCRDCFAALCGEVDGKDQPIACIGNLSDCSYVLPLKSLQDFLGHTEFEKLLAVSFEQYIRASPDRIQYCPTADCPTIYEVSQEPGIFTCANCLISICTKCRSLSHDELTCEEALTQGAEEEIPEDDRKRLGVQYCPVCKTGLHKDEGCNHVICRGCKTHICWFCLETFGSSQQCYNHMTNTHGNFGEGFLPLDAEEEQLREWDEVGAVRAGLVGEGVRWDEGFNPFVFENVPLVNREEFEDERRLMDELRQQAREVEDR